MPGPLREEVLRVHRRRRGVSLGEIDDPEGDEQRARDERADEHAARGELGDHADTASKLHEHAEPVDGDDHDRGPDTARRQVGGDHVRERGRDEREERGVVEQRHGVLVPGGREAPCGARCPRSPSGRCLRSSPRRARPRRARSGSGRRSPAARRGRRPRGRRPPSSAPAAGWRPTRPSSERSAVQAMKDGPATDVRGVAAAAGGPAADSAVDTTSLLWAGMFAEYSTAGGRNPLKRVLPSWQEPRALGRCWIEELRPSWPMALASEKRRDRR